MPVIPILLLGGVVLLVVSIASGAASAAAGAASGLITRVVEAWTAGSSGSVEVAEIQPNFFLRTDAAIAFKNMEAAAARDGVTLSVASAWRSMDQQKILYAMYLNHTGNLAAQPGYSNHQNGIAVDINTSGVHADAFRWLTDNAEDYGFIRTVPSEIWHWEYLPGKHKYIA